MADTTSVRELAEAKSATLPFEEHELLKLAREVNTPFHVYDEATIRQACRSLKEAFAWVPGRFINFYAVKANPNPEIVKIVKDEGFGADCSSFVELILAQTLGFHKDDIMFTSNNTPIEEYRKANEIGAIINLDDISHLEFLETKSQLPEILSFRFNPGAERRGNVIIGEPAEAKFGLTREQIFKAYPLAKAKGVKRFALHTMIVSNTLDIDELVETGTMMFEMAAELKTKHQVDIEFVNLGGGIGVPYKVDQKPVDIPTLGAKLEEQYNKLAKETCPQLGVVLECGRFIAAPAGCLVTRTIHQKRTHKNYVGVNGCMANLMRPAMYGAYHHATVIRETDEAALADLPDRKDLFDGSVEQSFKCDVVGGLCENNDKFAIDRELTVRPRIGDLIVISDAGGHGHAMGFNYNGRLKSAEYLKRADGRMEKIRRAETPADYFRTVECPGLPGQEDSCWLPSWSMLLTVAAAAGAGFAGARMMSRR